MKGRPGELLGVVAGRFHPDLASVHLHYPLGDRQTEARTFGLESNLAGTVLLNFPGLIEFFEYPDLIFPVNPYSCISDCHLDIEVVFLADTGVFGASTD